MDEVHERGIDSDFSLALILSAMKIRPDLKLIVMSATISTTKFSLYLGNSLGMTPSSVASKMPTSILDNDSSVSSFEAPEGGAPVLFIPGFTFPVEEFYKSDYEEAVSSSRNAGGEDNWMYSKRKGELDYGLLLNLLLALVEGKSDNLMLHRAAGSILVIL